MRAEIVQSQAQIPQILILRFGLTLLPSVDHDYIAFSGNLGQKCRDTLKILFPPLPLFNVEKIQLENI